MGRGQAPRYFGLEPAVIVQLLGDIASEYKDSAVYIIYPNLESSPCVSSALLEFGVTRRNLEYCIFTARCYASAVLAMGLCLSVSVCVCLSVSVTSRSSTETAKRRITQTTPHDSPGTLVF